MFWYGVNNAGEEVLLHTCHRGTRQLTPKLSAIRAFGYYEDGYFRGLKLGKRSEAWFKGSPYYYHIIKCKACGEIVKLHETGAIIE